MRINREKDERETTEIASSRLDGERLFCRCMRISHKIDTLHEKRCPGIWKSGKEMCLDVGVRVRSDRSSKVMAMKDEDGFLETHIDLKPYTLSHTRA